MQKPAFYAIVGISLIVTAVSLGYSTSRYLSIRYYAPPPPPPPGKEAASVARAPDLVPERWTNIFSPSGGMTIPSKLAGKDAGPASAPTTAYVLLGTITSDLPTARRAILWTEGMKQPLLAREHAEIEPGLRVTGIERDYIWITRGAAKEKLELLPIGSRTRSPTRPAPPPVASATVPPRAFPSSTEESINVNRIGENAFSLDEATVTQLTTNINQFMTQVRIIPYFEGNKSAGYRVAAIRPGSAFDQLGFRGGDIIQRINDLELSSPEKLHTIFQNLKDEKRVTVDILRQGQKSSLTYEIR
ncbi:MAG: type II secretion system protein GspC [Candidatus Deferrimicrobiaceae bacterium]